MSQLPAAKKSQKNGQESKRNEAVFTDFSTFAIKTL